MMKYVHNLALVLFISSSFTLSHAQSFMTEEGTAKFHSEVPLHSFTGTSEYLTGMINLDEGIVDFYLDLTTLDTGIGKRDRDMRETLEVEKYPFAEFYGSLDTPFNPDTTIQQDVTVSGAFTIHGVEREVLIDGTLQKTEEGLKLYASWVLLLEDYDIIPPQILFVKVDQEQKIEIEALLKPIQE